MVATVYWLCVVIAFIKLIKQLDLCGFMAGSWTSRLFHWHTCTYRLDSDYIMASNIISNIESFVFAVVAIFCCGSYSYNNSIIAS